jgi:hypothetical protein
MYADIGIKRNGNLLIGINRSFVTKNGNSWVDQTIYRTLMAADASMFTGLANATQIAEAIRNYLRGKIGSKLPFPFERLQLKISRTNEKTWTITIAYPSTDGGNATINMPLRQREGFLDDLTYDFQPNVPTPPAIRVHEIIRKTEPSNRLPLGHVYSGIGPIRIFSSESFNGNIFEEEVITVTKLTNRVKYNLYDYITGNENLEYNIDDVLVDKNQYIEDTDGSGYTIIDNTPFIFFTSNTPDGTTVKATIRKSKSITVSNEVIIENEDLQYRPQPLKMSRERHIAILAKPISAGTYIVIYNAIITNNRYPQ